MNKISNYILILSLLLLTNCGYQAVLNNQNYQFSINVNKINGDQKINSLIINRLKQLEKNEKIYNLNLTSNKEKLIRLEERFQYDLKKYTDYNILMVVSGFFNGKLKFIVEFDFTSPIFLPGV